jgi:hypothetical protein
MTPLSTSVSEILGFDPCSDLRPDYSSHRLKALICTSDNAMVQRPLQIFHFIFCVCVGGGGGLGSGLGHL